MYEDEVCYRLRNKRHLLPIFANINDLPQRIREYDPNFFVVFNTISQRYEVHSLAHRGNTYGFTSPYPELDTRTLEMVRKSDLRNRPLSSMVREMDRHNELLEQKLARQRRQDTIDEMLEYKSQVSKIAWGEV